MCVHIPNQSLVLFFSILLYCFQKCKTSQDVYDVSGLDSISVREYKHSDSGVLVTRRDGCATKVPCTIIGD